MADFKEVMQIIGRQSAKAGRFIGRKVANGYNSVDPDVRRHIAQVPLLTFSLFVPRKEVVKAIESDGHAPLIFVHGLGGNRGNFLMMALYLKTLGRKRSYKIHFDGGQSLDQMAKGLAKFVEDVKEVTGESQVEIVAHSMGGIAARLAILEHNLELSVKTLITLGTPHNGTYPARYANTDHIRDLRPDSELMRRINSHTWPKEIATYTFWSKSDVFVLPAESAVFAGAKQVDLTPFTHYSYLLDPKCFDEVNKALAIA